MEKIEKAENEQFTLASLKNRVFEEFRFICEEYQIELNDNNISPNRFNFVLQEINNRIINPNREPLLYLPNNQIDRYSNTRIDSNKLYIIYSKILKPLCNLYNQIISIELFSIFFGLEINIINNIIIYRQNSPLEIKKVINLDEKTNLKGYLYERKGNPLGILAVLKSEHNFDNPQSNSDMMDSNRLLNANNLPKLTEKHWIVYQET